MIDKKYHIIQSNHKFNVIKVLTIDEAVFFDIESTHDTLKLAEDAIPVTSCSSGNIAGATPGDDPIVKKKKRIQRMLRRFHPHPNN